MDKLVSGNPYNNDCHNHSENSASFCAAVTITTIQSKNIWFERKPDATTGCGYQEQSAFNTQKQHFDLESQEYVPCYSECEDNIGMLQKGIDHCIVDLTPSRKNYNYIIY